eukprot:6491388-Amphidinium_carterae.2
MIDADFTVEEALPDFDGETETENRAIESSLQQEEEKVNKAEENAVPCAPVEVALQTACQDVVDLSGASSGKVVEDSPPEGVKSVKESHTVEQSVEQSVSQRERREHELAGRLRLSKYLTPLMTDASGLEPFLDEVTPVVGETRDYIHDIWACHKAHYAEKGGGQKELWMEIWHIASKFGKKRAYEKIDALQQQYQKCATESPEDCVLCMRTTYTVMSDAQEKLSVPWHACKELTTKGKYREVWDAILLSVALPSRQECAEDFKGKLQSGAIVKKTDWKQKHAGEKRNASCEEVASGSNSRWKEERANQQGQERNEEGCWSKDHKGEWSWFVPPTMPVPVQSSEKSSSEYSGEDCEDDKKPGASENSHCWQKFGLLEVLERKAKKPRMDDNAPWNQSIRQPLPPPPPQAAFREPSNGEDTGSKPVSATTTLPPPPPASRQRQKTSAPWREDKYLGVVPPPPPVRNWQAPPHVVTPPSTHKQWVQEVKKKRPPAPPMTFTDADGKYRRVPQPPRPSR